MGLGDGALSEWCECTRATATSTEAAEAPLIADKVPRPAEKYYKPPIILYV